MPRLELPDNEKDLADSLDVELRASESEMGTNRCTWQVVDGYLRGARKFNVLDRFSGRVSIGYASPGGGLRYRNEDIVRRYLVEVGRWLRSDISPVVTRRGESLDDMRNAAIANAVLSARAKSIDLKRLKSQLIVPYVKYGVVGIGHYETVDPLHPDQVEVIPARQLRGLPAFCEGLECLQGVARKRWMPYAWVKQRVYEMYDVNLDRYDIERDLMGVFVGWGTPPPGTTGDFGDSVSLPAQMMEAPSQSGVPFSIHEHLGSGFDDQPEDVNRNGRYYVPMEEVYPYMDEMLYAARYILKVGKRVIFQDDFEAANKRVVCPLQVARYTDTGSFFSRGFVAPLIPANDQFEKVVSSVARNLRELDVFGTTYVSGGMGIDLKTANKPAPRPRFAKYNIDPLAPGAQPFNLAPGNPGLLPVKFGEFLRGITESLAGQGPFYDGQAAGRMDSAAGHGFLFNAGNVGLGLPSHNLADALSAVYSRILQAARASLKQGETIKLAKIDESLAGVVFNPKSGEIELSENPVPAPWQVDVDVKDRTPSDPDIRKRQLNELHAAGLLGETPEEAFLQYWLTVIEENLGVIGVPKEIRETHRKCIWQIIQLFNDGETPGPLELGEMTQNPAVHLRLLKRFMSKIEFSLASEDVQREFELWAEQLEQMTGTYPAGLPLPEEGAMAALPGINAQMQGAQPQAAGGGADLAALGAQGAF